MEAVKFKATQHILLATMGVAWILIVAGGLVLLGDRGQRAGGSAAISDWPSDSKLFCHPGQPTLVLFLHPHCPCSRATLEELARALAHRKTDSPVYTVFAIPAALPQWGATSLIDFAGQIPGVTVVVDRDGIECGRFGAITSGQALLFNAAGRIIFNGGLTPSRGHEGDSIGRDIVEQVVVQNQRIQTRVESNVFGCALFRPAPSVEVN